MDDDDISVVDVAFAGCLGLIFSWGPIILIIWLIAKACRS